MKLLANAALLYLPLCLRLLMLDISHRLSPLIMPSIKPLRHSSLRSGVHQPEHVIEDVVAAVLGQKLERLRIAHRPPLGFDQECSADDDKNSA